jgi:hypothetical protein
MAPCAIVREDLRYVVWQCRARKICRMAHITVGELEIVVSVCVAGNACGGRVSACQWEIGAGMVERCRLPCSLCVALRTVVTELARHVARIGRSIEICCMAVPAGLKQTLVLVVHMALVACNSLMRTHQREGRCRMAECRRLPHCRGVAGCTVMV